MQVLLLLTVAGSLLASKCAGHRVVVNREALTQEHTAASNAAGSCKAGMHVQLEHNDNHIVNPNCGKNAVGGACDRDLTHHFILERPLEQGASGSGLCRDFVKFKPLFDEPSEYLWDTDSPSTCDFLSGRIHFRCAPGGSKQRKDPPKTLYATSATGATALEEFGEYHLQEEWKRDGRPIWKKKVSRWTNFNSKQYLLFFSSNHNKWYVSDELEDQGFYQGIPTAQSHAFLPIGLQWTSSVEGVNFTIEAPPLLVVDDSDCRELLPFSVIHEHDPTRQVRRASNDWTTRPSTMANSFGLASYTCGPPPKELVLPGDQNVEHLSDDTAVERCAQTPDCRAVAISASRTNVHMLREFACTVASTKYVGFAEGERVLWRGPEVPEGSIGVVTKPWHSDSDEGWLSVRFGQQDFSLPADGLERMLEPSSPDWSVTQIVGSHRKVRCTAMNPWYSCDIQRASDAAILFMNRTSSAKECRRACKAKTANSRVLKTCCVFTGGVCALTRGEHFAMMLDDEGKSTQTLSNKDPQQFEAAAECQVTPCSEDPKCTVASKTYFEAPQDAHVNRERSSPSDLSGVDLYFDFAHPLSMPFKFARAMEDTQAAIFHFSSADSKILSQARKDPNRLLRIVGSFKGSMHMPKPDVLKTGLYSSWAHGRGKSSSVKGAQRLLDATCDEFGKEIGKSLKAPHLDIALESRGQCVGDHSSIHSPDFEACLVRVGCRHLGIEGDWLPFHGPWFSKLPFDIIAWQQPAPFCCAKPHTIDSRAEDLRKQFFEQVGLHGEELEDVQDEQFRKRLEVSVQDGSKSVRSWLIKYAQDEQTLTWVAGFVKQANKVLSRFMRDFEDTVDSEGDDDVEVAADGQSFLQVHEDGDQVAPSGRRAVEVARWSDEKGSFLQVALSNNTLAGRAWNFTKTAAGAIYQHGLKPLWKHVFGPIIRWGLSVTKWIIEHPRAALFLSKVALVVRERLCEKASQLVYGDPEIEAVGLFTKAAGTLNKTKQYIKKTFSPAVLLSGLQKAVSNSNAFEKMKSLGAAAFGLLMGWAGVATGGASFAIVGGVASMLADAAIDAGKQALEFMIYQEIMMEVPSNIFNMVFSKCIQEPETMQMFSASATVREASDAARQSVEFVVGQVSTQGQRLSKQIGNLASFFDKKAK
eukprot:TRINITY_DN44839_c0_g1_i1.p1 TRINITY_DN44839_c0_g1~~TRINITY_DN44839_c0_g1_i1.p1  ORF type:complete len:1149 (-),score=192.36 TRINITY_DN44839_c0_g1_i1:113-3559(-)